MQKSAKYALIAVVVVLVGGAGLAWWYLSDDAEPRASLRDRPAVDADEGDAEDGPVATAGGQVDDDPATPTLAGTWVIEQGDEVFVGYRIDELFGGETIKKTAVGRTTAVEGSLTIDGAVITEADVVADLTELRSDQTRRDDQLRSRGLQTDEFPEATFVLTDPIDMQVLPDQGDEVAVTAVGDLTLHGVTQPVEITLTARWTGDALDVAGSVPIVLADYGIEKPDTPVVTVDEVGELELQLTFVPE